MFNIQTPRPSHTPSLDRRLSLKGGPARGVPGKSRCHIISDKFQCNTAMAIRSGFIRHGHCRGFIESSGIPYQREFWESIVRDSLGPSTALASLATVQIQWQSAKWCRPSQGRPRFVAFTWINVRVGLFVRFDLEARSGLIDLIIDIIDIIDITDIIYIIDINDILYASLSFSVYPSLDAT